MWYVWGMLTKKDVAIIDDLLDRKLEQKLEQKLDQKLKPVQEDIVKIRKDQKQIVNFFDREYLDLRKRVERIEHHLDLRTAS